ncbi:unnamed protein product [Trypanosoma congolense IL3000]|uniref:WGS project CAEQ00000000 data, annotated contig 1715 n=1 Tax=Trypanosoma congolense (strain IL3000) TaxID=1068625 RepID=F9W882_TRYCI|nr:unnamed protein product [Trypanosoma congolense IL3000]
MREFVLRGYWYSVFCLLFVLTAATTFTTTAGGANSRCTASVEGGENVLCRFTGLFHKSHGVSGKLLDVKGEELRGDIDLFKDKIHHIVGRISGLLGETNKFHQLSASDKKKIEKLCGDLQKKNEEQLVRISGAISPYHETARVGKKVSGDLLKAPVDGRTCGDNDDHTPVFEGGAANGGAKCQTLEGLCRPHASADAHEELSADTAKCIYVGRHKHCHRGMGDEVEKVLREWGALGTSVLKYHGHSCKPNEQWKEEVRNLTVTMRSLDNLTTIISNATLMSGVYVSALQNILNALQYGYTLEGIIERAKEAGKKGAVIELSSGGTPSGDSAPGTDGSNSSSDGAEGTGSSSSGKAETTTLEEDVDLDLKMDDDVMPSSVRSSTLGMWLLATLVPFFIILIGVLVFCLVRRRGQGADADGKNSSVTGATMGKGVPGGVRGDF